MDLTEKHTVQPESMDKKVERIVMRIGWGLVIANVIVMTLGLFIAARLEKGGYATGRVRPCVAEPFVSGIEYPGTKNTRQ